MEIIWSDRVDEILRTGYYLGDSGVHNWAFFKSHALEILNLFRANNIPILGGDVYIEINGNIRPNYDSWYCSTFPGEAHSDFIERSINKAKEYIEAYKADATDKIYVVFVPKV